MTMGTLSATVLLFVVGFCSVSSLEATCDSKPLEVVIREAVDEGGVWPNTEDQHGSSSDEGTFWQITDIHWDQRYSDVGDPSKMCHRGYTVTGHNGIYGTYLCDSPWPLVKSAIEAMAEIHNAPDFILWTGDNVPHTNDPEPDFSVIFETISNVTGELRTSFPDSVPILPVLGNHDAYPKDDYPVAGEEFYGQYLTKGGWAAVLPPEAQNEFKQGGYYGYELPTGITVLVVNTNLYYAFNELGVNAKDPCGQFAWMRKRLQQAKDCNTKVIIAAHAPPGYFERYPSVPFFNETYNSAYVDLLNEFGESIMAQIYGHEHTDSFRLFSTEGKTESVAFLAPSVTPWYPSNVTGGTAINPSVRLYTYSKSTVLDYTQYHLNLTKVNELLVEVDSSGDSTITTDKTPVKIQQVKRPNWELYYQARNTYGLQSLDTVNMASLFNKLSSDDNLLQQYYLMNSAGYNNGICDPQCRKYHLCSIANIKIKDLKSCMENPHSGPHKFVTKHPKIPVYVMEDGFPVSVDTLSSSPNSSHAIIAVIALSMTLTVVLAFILAVMLVMIMIKRNRILNTENSFPVADLMWGHRRQRKYRQLP